MGSPIESHATSYVSTNFGGSEGNLGTDNSGYGAHALATPVITHHELPTVYHKVVTPIVKKVPVYLQHAEYQDEEHVSLYRKYWRCFLTNKIK